MTPEREDWLRRWMSDVARGPDQARRPPCPDAGTMAAYIDRKLAPRLREEVLQHATDCPSCRDLLTEMTEPGDATIVQPATAPRLRVLASLLAMAAVVVILLVLQSRGPSSSLEERCRTAALRLAEEEPELLAGFHLLDATALEAGTVLRAGDSLALEPVGRIPGRRPPFRWRAVPGAERYTVRLLTGDGVRLWQVTSATPSMEYPADELPLTAGTAYVWEVHGQGDLGEQRSSLGFQVLSAAEWEAIQAALTLIDRGFRSVDVDLGKAHFLIGRGLWSHAEPFAARFAMEHPDAALGQETLDAIRRHLGRDP